MAGKSLKPLQPKILLLEDEEVLGKLYVKHLSEAGYQVTLCTRLDDVLEVSRKIKPDLALLDHAIRGDDRSGMEIIPLLKKENPAIKVVMLSNYSEFQMASQAKGMGADDYLLKINTSPRQLGSYLKKITGLKRPI